MLISVAAPVNHEVEVKVICLMLCESPVHFALKCKSGQLALGDRLKSRMSRGVKLKNRLFNIIYIMRTIVHLTQIQHLTHDIFVQTELLTSSPVSSYWAASFSYFLPLILLRFVSKENVRLNVFGADGEYFVRQIFGELLCIGHDAQIEIIQHFICGGFVGFCQF